MPQLPYAPDALEPVISQATILLHHGKHLQAYADNLEKLIQGTALENASLAEIVIQAPAGPLFNNAGQVLNHQLYFAQFTPTPRISIPDKELAEAINRDFGSFDEFKKLMNQASLSLFGSGWVWLCLCNDKLEIISCANGDNPLRHGKKPLLGFDVWEHAYYMDYQNRRADHIHRLWEIIDWEEVNRRM